MAYESINPATGEKIRSFDVLSPDQLEASLARAQKEFLRWRETSFAQRAQVLLAAADLLEQNATEHAEIMTREMGKPIADGEAEAKKCAWVCRYYAEHAAQFLQPQFIATDAGESFVRYDPLGPIFAIMPWNFPYWQLFRHAAPAIMVGNVILLKHTHQSPECGLRLDKLFREAGAPEGVFQTLLVDRDGANHVIADDRVHGVTLTGSTGAGRKIAEASGKHLKKTVLELGGSDPFVVFDDVDVEEAAAVSAKARCINSGQSCIAAKRFIVHKSIVQKYTDIFVQQMKAMKMGDPMERDTNIGPMARKDLRDELHEQVEKSVKMGARLLLGGKVPEGNGFYYPPTVITDAPADSPVRKEETFGPVAVIIPFETEEEAIAIANETEFGLGAAVWSQDQARIKRVVPKIEAGAVFVNGFVKSDPRLPFGGVKNSGYGRELSREGLLEFANQKTVWIK